MKAMRSSTWAVLFYCLQCWRLTNAFSPLAHSFLTSPRFSKSKIVLSLSDQLEQSEDSNTNANSQNQPPVPRTPPRQPKLDPLMVSVTRNNDPTYDPNAPKVSVPLIGEVALDRSLFVFLPVAAFAVIGLITSIVVLVNSRDVFVDAIQQSTAEILTPSSTTIDSSQCRGLCSQQDESLEEMRVFMNKFARK